MIALCIDAGTSLVKCVAFDEEGVERRVASAETVVANPHPGWAEQDMLGVWRAVADTVHEVVASVDEPVELLAFTAQGDGCWLVDADGEPTGPAILWNDARAADLVATWERDGVLEAAFRICGSVGFAGLAHAILAWLAEREPERVKRSAAALSCDGWLFSRLTGELAIDSSDASNPFLDVVAGEYSSELLDLFDLAWAERLLPPVRDGAGRVGALSAHAARTLGLPERLPVVMGPYDVVATAIGVGATAPGSSCCILGTTLCTELVVDRPRLDGGVVGMTLRTGIPGRWTRTFATLAGTEVIDWACELLGLGDPALLSELAMRASTTADPLVFIPYLSPAGERAPFNDPAARGGLVGLSLQHRREAIARSVFEGLALAVHDCLQAAGQPEELRVCGGGAASSYWCQLIADVTGVPVRRPVDSQSGAKGALVTALVATGRQPDFDAAAAALVRVGDTFEPDPDLHDHHRHSYERFLELRAASQERQWPVLAAARNGVANGAALAATDGGSG
jgi:erythritol kinase (D-erythritol 1-phosphate-forming)